MAKKKKSAKTTAGIELAPSHDDWEAKECLHTLKRAQEIVGNKGLMKRVRTHAKKERDVHDRLARLEGKLL